jgi:hypothetical protein
VTEIKRKCVEVWMLDGGSRGGLATTWGRTVDKARRTDEPLRASRAKSARAEANQSIEIFPQPRGETFNSLSAREVSTGHVRRENFYIL